MERRCAWCDTADVCHSVLTEYDREEWFCESCWREAIDAAMLEAFRSIPNLLRELNLRLEKLGGIL
jgi:hypothetical protein